MYMHPKRVVITCPVLYLLDLCYKRHLLAIKEASVISTNYNPSSRSSFSVINNELGWELHLPTLIIGVSAALQVQKMDTSSTYHVHLNVQPQVLCNRLLQPIT